MPRTVGDIATQGLTELPMTLADELAGLLRGSAKVTLGAPGDINEIARDYIAPLMPYRFRQILEGLQNVPALPTSEELDKKFAPVLPEGADPRRKIAAKIGEGAGEWTPFNPVAATRMAGRAAGRGLKAVDKAISTSPTSGGRKSQRGVMKAPGGNWLQNHVLNKELEDLKSSATRGYSSAEDKMARMIEQWPESEIIKLPESQQRLVRLSFDNLKQDIALNNWVDSNVGNYVKKQMGTEGDPIRALAEQGITHKYLGDRYGGNPGGVTAGRRAEQGFPEEGFGNSPEARQWEHASDVALRPTSAGYLVRNEPFDLDQNPWLSKLDPNTPVHRLSSGAMEELGFDKILQNIQDDLRSGDIRPEQLNKISMPDAVQRVFAKNEAERKAKELAEAEAIKANLSLNPYKEYPSGHKWITLPDPLESDQSMKAVKDIGCQGGWCTQQEDNAKHYGDPSQGNFLHVLLDPSGKPHIQVHVDSTPLNQRVVGRNLPQSAYEQITNQADEWATQRSNELGRSISDQDHYIDKGNKAKELDKQFRIDNPEYQYPERITQIKPFSNTWDSPMVRDATKKNPNYRKDIEPFIQDFVRSNKWEGVDDVDNTGLVRRRNVFDGYIKETLNNLGYDVPEFLTPTEVKTFQDALANTKEFPVIKGDEPPPLVPNLDLGFKRGGKVNLEDQYRLNKLNGTILGTQHRM